jgi:flagellar basal body rod protein FlgB
VKPEIYERKDLATRLDGNNVSMESEVDQAARNQLLYNTYLAMFKGKSKLLFTSMSGNF